MGIFYILKATETNYWSSWFKKKKKRRGTGSCFPVAILHKLLIARSRFPA